METIDKSKEQLVKENNQLRARIDKLQKHEVEIQNIEDKLKESQLLAKLLYNSSQPFVVGNTDGTLSKVNSAFCKLTGYTEYELLNNVSWNNTLTPKKWWKYEEELLTKVITTGDPQLYEKEYIRKDGEIISVELLMHRSLDDDNKIDYVYGFINDITQRKQAEIELQESELRFKALHNASFGGITIHDKGLILDCNEGFANITGYTIDELTGMDGLLLIEEVSRKKVLENILSGYEKPYEAIGLRKNGEQYPLRLEARKIPYKGEEVRVVEFRDITESKQVEIALQESELHYRTLFNESPIPLWEEDFSEVKKHIDKLKENKIVDFKEYFDDNPEELREIAGLVKIIDINNATLQLHDANSKEELLKGLLSTFTNDSFIAFKDELIAITNGKTKYNSEGVVKTLKGKLKHVQLTWHVLPGYENSYGKVFLSTVDITESKEMEETVIKEKNKAMQYLDIADIMLVSVDSSGIVKLINPKGCEILGYSEDEIVGQNWFDNFLPERLRKNVKAVSKKIFAGEMESAAYYENQIITKAGEERLIAWHNAIYRDDKGNIIGSLSSGEDITERKEADIKLQQSEEKYRTLSDDSIIPIVIHDINGEIKYGNQALVKSLKAKNLHEVLKTPVINFIHPDYIEESTTVMKRMFEGKGNFRKEQKFIRFDGQSIDVDISAKLISYNNEKAIQLTFNDITERKRAEQALKNNEETLSLALNGSGAGLWSWNIKTGEDLLDERWCGIFGYKKEELKQEVSTWEKMIHPDDKERIFDDIQKHFEDENNEYNNEYRVKCKNGDWKWIHTLGKLVERDSDGNPYRMSGIIIDIDDRKLVDNELNNHREHLEQLVIERTAEVDEKNQKLSDQLKVFVGRELKIRDLEKKIRKMEEKMGKN